MTNARRPVSFRTLIVVSVCGAALVALAASGFEWITPLVFIIVGLLATIAAIVSTVKLILQWGRSRFHFSLFHVMLFVTWLAIFCAAERFLMTSAWARRLAAGPDVHVLAAGAAFYAGVLFPWFWRERRRQKAARPPCTAGKGGDVGTPAATDRTDQVP